MFVHLSCRFISPLLKHQTLTYQGMTILRLEIQYLVSNLEPMTILVLVNHTTLPSEQRIDVGTSLPVLNAPEGRKMPTSLKTEEKFIAEF